MKVTRGEKKFEPITITLETEEEATIIWACLAYMEPAEVRKYLDGKNMECANTILIYHMYSCFSNVYVPRSKS